MIPAHSSTAEQKVQWVSQLLAHEGSYGEVSRLSRSRGISRQSLYEWKAKGKHALEEAFTSAPVQKRLKEPGEVQRAILTLFTEAHASYRGIQACLRVIMGKEVSVGSICATIQAAGQRALDCLQKQGLGKAAVLAVDEQYQGQKEGYRSAA